MPEPREYTAVRNLQTALLAIAVGSGYFHTVAAAAVKLDPNVDVQSLVPPSGPRPFLVIELGKENWRRDPSMQLVLRKALTVYWIGESDPTVDESWMQEYFRGCADIEQAIYADESLGGVITELNIVDRKADAGFGSEVWGIVDLEMRVDRTIGLPNT